MDRKAEIRRYKEREATAGIYAIRCTATGDAWVGATPSLDKIANRQFFTLRQGTNPNAALQAAWNRSGGDAFVLEPIEMLGEDVSALARPRVLKERLAHWLEALEARRI